MSGPGHNGGPSMEPGASWRRHCWSAARETLLPHVPLEVLRGRLRRAAELGLDYRTYAGIRATTGRDVIAVLFSSNALDARAGTQPDAGKRARLAAIAGASRLGMAIRPLSPPVLHRLAPELDAAHPAPLHLSSFAETRSRLRDALGTVPSDAAILVGDHALEADWVPAGRLAGYISAQRFFTG